MLPTAASSTKVAIVAFDGFNELDTFIPLGILSCLGAAGWKAEIAGPASRLTSMNGVTLETSRPLEFANEADVVLFSGGLYTRAIAENSAIIDRLALDPLRQLIGGQCSGALLLARLGLLADMPACTDLTTKPWLIEAGVRVDGSPFHARGPIATAGGSLSSILLATWVMLKREGQEAATQALQQSSPVGDGEYVAQVIRTITPFV